jgi:hypothetical protein
MTRCLIDFPMSQRDELWQELHTLIDEQVKVFRAYSTSVESVAIEDWIIRDERIRELFGLLNEKKAVAVAAGSSKSK